MQDKKTRCTSSCQVVEEVLAECGGWDRRRDLNPGPPDPQSGALPD